MHPTGNIFPLLQNLKPSDTEEDRSRRMAKNLVAQVGKAKGEFELVEREILEPGVGGGENQGRSERDLFQRPFYERWAMAGSEISASAWT
jgi:hypothetical protein